MPIANIKDMLECRILGIIPEDIAVKESQVMKNAVILTHPKSRSARQYIDTSRRILGDDVEFQNPVKTSILGNLLRNLGLKR